MKPVLITIAGGGMPQIENAIGVIKAIQEVDMVMRFDRMLGTSAGALVAAMHASYDQDITKLEKVVRESSSDCWFHVKKWQAIKSIFSKSNYVADDTKLKEFLLEEVNKKAADTVSVSVTDMGPYGKDPVVCGTLMLPATARTVLASMSFQHIFPPVVWDGRMYADGGVFNLCPLPKASEFGNYEHVYIVLAAQAQLLPTVKHWPFVNQLLNLLDRTMEREVEQIKELALDELPNVTVIQPASWTKSANFLSWSKKFEQIDASYEFANNLLVKRSK